MFSDQYNADTHEHECWKRKLCQMTPYWLSGLVEKQTVLLWLIPCENLEWIRYCLADKKDKYLTTKRKHYSVGIACRAWWEAIWLAQFIVDTDTCLHDLLWKQCYIHWFLTSRKVNEMRSWYQIHCILNDKMKSRTTWMRVGTVKDV